MNFYFRSAIGLLAGVGAGTVGFWLAWQALTLALGEAPWVGYDNWLVASIFGPGILTSAFVFHALSRATGRPSAARFLHEE